MMAIFLLSRTLCVALTFGLSLCGSALVAGLGLWGLAWISS